MFITHCQEWDAVQMKNFESLCKIDEGVGYILLSAVILLQNPGKLTHVLYAVHGALKILAPPSPDPKRADNHNLINRTRGISSTLSILITIVKPAPGKVPVVNIRSDHVEG
jgi:hypothetical protein